MASDDWYFSPEMQAAREQLLSAHEALRDSRSSGGQQADHHEAAARALAADRAYFHQFPANQLHVASHSDSDDEWDATDAAASTIEGFTPGDPG